MRIGILQTGDIASQLVVRHENYGQMFAEYLSGHGFEFVTFDVVGGQMPADADAADGWLITGSRHGVYEDHDWIEALSALIREIYAAKRPMVGVCFGHQIIAQALGGHVEKFAGGWSVGPVDYPFEGCEKPLTIYAWHQDQVITPPKGARTVAATDFCAHAALEYEDAPIFTLQPHPEFEPDYLRKLVEVRGPNILSAAQRAELLEADAPDLAGAEIAARFVELFRAHGPGSNALT